MLLTELKEIDFEKEKEDAILCDDFEYSDKLDCYISKSSNEPLNGKYYHPDEFEEICYYKNGKWHRDGDLPARIFKDDGAIYYYSYNKLHRILGPAVIYPSGYIEWWINDYEIVIEEMNNWFNEHNIPLDWNLWTDSDKFLFALYWSDYNG